MTYHNPRYLYDCDNCKFSWNCGPCCACALTLGAQHKYPKPPKSRMYLVNLERRMAGLTEQFDLDKEDDLECWK